jgi:DNA invertase Pin-like site-specific DNA recombinase
VAELEREIIRERVKAGLQAAKRRGIKLGRKRVWVDVDRALAMRVEGKSLRKIATALGVGLATLCRALKKAEAGDVPKTSLEPRSQTVESGGSAADQLAA